MTLHLGWNLPKLLSRVGTVKAMRASLLILVGAMLLKEAAADYQVKAINCLNPTNIQRFQRKTLCQPNADKADVKPFLLLQESRVTEFTGHSCRVTYSEFRFRCGVWDHLKMQQVPKIQHQESVSRAWCRSMQERRQFKVDASHAKFPIKLNRENIIPIVEVGALWEEGDRIHCTGETLHEDNNIHTNLVILREYHVTVQEEKFLMGVDQSIEAVYKHEKLPCNLRAGGCVTGQHTYVFDVPKESCSLQYIRTTHVRPTRGTYLVDESLSLLFNQTKETRVTGCPFEVTATQFSGLYLAHINHKQAVQELSAANLEIDLLDRMEAEMSQYYREEIVSDLAKQNKVRTCSRVQNSITHRPMRVKGDLYALVAGDLVYQFHCKVEAVKLLESDSCFEDIPVENGLFMDPITKILKKHSSKRPCSSHYPMTIEAEGVYVEVNPHIRKTTTPKTYEHGVDGNTKHIDRSQAGLYSEKELRSWEQLVNLPAFQEALLTEVSWGTCIQSGECSSPTSAEQQPQWRLDPLDLEEWNLWTYFTKLVHQYGDECALAVLIYLGLKLIINLVLLSLTLMREGPGACLALLFSLYLSNHQQFNKIRRRHQKMKKKEERKAKESPQGHEMEDML